MTESEAKTILEAEIVHHAECSIFAEALGMAIKALEKQIPKKLMMVYDDTDDEDICYNRMEKTGYAVFGCCKGLEEKLCENCRYHVNVKENNKNE